MTLVTIKLHNINDLMNFMLLDESFEFKTSPSLNAHYMEYDNNDIGEVHHDYKNNMLILVLYTLEVLPESIVKTIQDRFILC